MSKHFDHVVVNCRLTLWLFVSWLVYFGVGLLLVSKMPIPVMITMCFELIWFVLLGCLDPDRDFKLFGKKQLSHNVAKFRFAVPKLTVLLGLPIGQHISCKLALFSAFDLEIIIWTSQTDFYNCNLPQNRGKDSVGEEVIKPYTVPTTLDSDVGYFELVIKVSKLKTIIF